MKIKTFRRFVFGCLLLFPVLAFGQTATPTNTVTQTRTPTLTISPTRTLTVTPTPVNLNSESSSITALDLPSINGVPPTPNKAGHCFVYNKSKTLTMLCAGGTPIALH